MRIGTDGVERFSSLDDASSAHDALECSSSESRLAADAGEAAPLCAMAWRSKAGAAQRHPLTQRSLSSASIFWIASRLGRGASAARFSYRRMSTYIDKPRFHKPTHPARMKPAPADTANEPTAARLPLLTSPSVPHEAPPLQSHAQAGLELQRRASDDDAEQARQRQHQLALLEDLKPQLRKELPLLGVRCDAARCSQLAQNKDVQPYVFRSKRSKHIAHDPAGDTTKRVLQLCVSSPDDVPPALQAAIDAAGGELVRHPVIYDWDYWTVDQVLRAVLPVELEEGAPSAFSMVGHIAHVNLREEYLAYRYLIGQVILEKTPRVETVVNKLDVIETEFRVFAMELLAGEPRYEAEVSESNCVFTLDFRHVYWNSRLHTEHARLIDTFQPFQVIGDVMAGVGPFAVPAAKKGCWVLANDLNPACYESLSKNAVRNHVEAHCRASCEDGRAFIRACAVRAWDAAFPAHDDSLLTGRQKRRMRREPPRELPPPPPPGRPRRLIDHFVMNLPATALEFLDAYRGLYTALAQHAGAEALAAELDARRGDTTLEPYPMVHVHCFTKEVERAADDICAVRMHSHPSVPAKRSAWPPTRRCSRPARRARRRTCRCTLCAPWHRTRTCTA